MMDGATLERMVARAALAPTVHNTQPARWRREGDRLLLAFDLSVGLTVGDPTGADAGLSCGAVAEAMVLALSAKGIGARVDDLWLADDCATWPGHRLAARLTLAPGGQVDGLHAQLENRFTFRGAFEAAPISLFGWTRVDAALVLDGPGKAWLADRNDWAALQIMRVRGFRRELLSWMRLSPRHRRYGDDGLNRAAMRMSGAEAFAARFALGPLWGALDLLSLTKGLTGEAAVTQTAAVIACFHRPADESPVSSGRAYLRMGLEAAGLGMAGWPMAALSDHPVTRAEVCDRFGVGADRRLVQVIRFGVPTGPMPPRARRPISEVLL